MSDTQSPDIEEAQIEEIIEDQPVGKQDVGPYGVQALKEGFFEKQRFPGDRFQIDKRKQFSKNWMRYTDPEDAQDDEEALVEEDEKDPDLGGLDPKNPPEKYDGLSPEQVKAVCKIKGAHAIHKGGGKWDAYDGTGTRLAVDYRKNDASQLVNKLRVAGDIGE